MISDCRIDPLGQLYRCRGHRHRAGTDVGLRAHHLGHRKSALKKLVEQQSERTGRFGGAHRALELAQNLRLAQHHRVEPAGDAKGVFDRKFLWQLIQMRFEVVDLELVKIGQPLHGLPWFGGITVDFGAVAGRDDGRLFDRVAFDQVAQSLHHVFGAKYHLLAQRQRRGMVVDTEGK